MKTKKITALLLALGCTLALSGCGEAVSSVIDSRFEPIDAATTDSTAPVTLPTETTVITTTTAPPIPPDITVHALAVGDNLVQTRVYQAAQKYSADGQSYDFTKCYENIVPIVQAADIAIINQETLICGPGYEISGSNFNFNSPVELGDAMVDVGFDVFVLANNHMLDKGINGLSSTLDYWDGMMSRFPIMALGAYRNESDQSTIRIEEVDGLTIAFLAYTEHMNGYQLPAGTDIRVGMTGDTALIERQIKAAKQLADAVVVAAHRGDEDTHTVRPGVQDLAHKMIGWGADVILGSHPHTAQTMEFVDRPDGTRGFVYYSLGNFISAQTDNFNMIGEIGEFDLVKSGETGLVTVTNVTCAPVITHYDDGMLSNLRLYPYPMYTAELASSHGLPYAPLGTAKAFNMDVVNAIVNANIPEEFRKLDWTPEELVPSDAVLSSRKEPEPAVAPADPVPEQTSAAAPPQTTEQTSAVTSGQPAESAAGGTTQTSLWVIG